MSKRRKEQCKADAVDANDMSIWRPDIKQCNRCNAEYPAVEWKCPKCRSPEYSLVLRTE